MTNIEILKWQNLSAEKRRQLLQRPRAHTSSTLKEQVSAVLKRVQNDGDSAVLQCTAEFDGVREHTLRVSDTDLLAAKSSLDPRIERALQIARSNIEAFHAPQKPRSLEIETRPGIVCRKIYLPIERVGLYIPAGSAPLLSTLLMLAVPAKIAGCSELILATPPQKSTGLPDPRILALAKILQVDQVFAMGGAQAIAAMAFGTQSVAKVDKIFGPGNAWVTEAKVQVSLNPNGACIDMPAGPSELCVVADALADSDFVASDLLSQAEHDRDSQVLLISDSEQKLSQVLISLRKQLSALPRKEIAETALQSSRFVLVRDLKQAIEVSNAYAPEHLILNCNEASSLAMLVKNAGSVFIGAYTPESVGDYASGTNHVLPTAGYARSMSGLGVEHFMKAITFQELSASALTELAETVETLAQTEGLMGHANAVALRRISLQGAK